MEEKNILAVINELGEIFLKHKDQIKFKDFEIERLNKKIKQIEDYANFYVENTITKEEYQNIKREKL